MEGNVRADRGARSSRRWIWLLLAVVVIIGGLVVFEPWKLFVDKTVNEAAPGGIDLDEAIAASPGETEDEGERSEEEEAEPPAEPRVTLMGEFVSLAHEGRGTASLIELPDGKRYLRFEEFEVENGPDLVVLLSPAPAEGGDQHNAGAYEVDGLKGNVGNQNYEIPEDVDLSKYRSVVVWCKPFGVAFAAAPLEG